MTVFEKFEAEVERLLADDALDMGDRLTAFNDFVEGKKARGEELT